jgi:hypothetical protein
MVVWLLMMIWHWYQCLKLEDHFIKRYDEAESYWIDLRNTYRNDIKTACKRIVELDEENMMLRDAMQFCSGSCRVSSAILETRRVSEDDPD